MMKQILKFSMSMSLLFGLAWFSACGKSEDGTTANGTCQAGYVQSQYGCLQQGHCGSGYALYNNQCTLVNNVNYASGGQCQAGYVQSQYGCVPQNGCPQGSGYYNGSCVPATYSGSGSCSSNMCGYGMVMTSYGCLPRDTSGYCQQRSGGATGCFAAVSGYMGIQCIQGY